MCRECLKTSYGENTLINFREDEDGVDWIRVDINCGRDFTLNVPHTLDDVPLQKLDDFHADPPNYFFGDAHVLVGFVTDSQSAEVQDCMLTLVGFTVYSKKNNQEIWDAHRNLPRLAYNYDMLQLRDDTH